MNVLVAVEDDADIRMLVRMQFMRDPDFSIMGECADIPSAIDAVTAQQPDLIVLDHKLEGEMTGLAAAPLLKECAPNVKIVLFTASEELRVPAAQEPAVDAFLLKTHINRLVALSKELLGE